MMTSRQIRQSYLDFFKEKQHTIVPSSSLMPDSPNLLFTNAGMNQFVPIFLGQTQCPYTPGRAADTQKCIRAGGKHNDLDDVGLDTYHHTFFEMLGNWSFGDYFKKEAIEWAWELVVERWGFPANRVYATIYNPDKALGDPAERDEEAYAFWAEKFTAAGIDPAIHIVNGNKKDNFWMMGETGPCGPCSELHIDLTPEGDTKGSLVNMGDARCIEIWNLVFIQFNANPDGTFSPLPAQHVDTGMGFERVRSIIQGTKGFTDFANAKISNYDTDIFRPIFDELEKMSGLRYTSTLPGSPELAKNDQSEAPDNSANPISPESEGVFVVKEGQSLGKSGVCNSEYPSSVESAGVFVTEYPSSEEKPVPYSHTSAQNEQKSPKNDQIAIDIAFRVIADHIRTLSFAIADGIQPGNNDRNYVLRRILRRAVRYGRTLGFKEPFFYKLVGVLAREMGDIFPEIRTKQKLVEETLKREEEAFNKTLDKGIALFETEAAKLLTPPEDAVRWGARAPSPAVFGALAENPSPTGEAPTSPTGAQYAKRRLPHFERPWGKYSVTFSTHERKILTPAERDLALQSVLYAHEHGQYELYAACVMPDHVHLLFEPQIKPDSPADAPIFWSLSEILQGIKSASAHRINKAAGQKGTVWDGESFDRLIRSESDLQEKFVYIVENPWKSEVVRQEEEYPWMWTPGKISAALPGGEGFLARAPKTAGEGARAPHAAPAAISAEFAFKLYDEQGFPLDLTELMARERGLTVDVAGFEKLMEEQRNRARAAQKKTVIELSEGNISELKTEFVGYDFLDSDAEVGFVRDLPEQHFVTVTRSPLYAEMGGQVGDTGILTFQSVDGSDRVEILNTSKTGTAFFLKLSRPVRLRNFSQGSKITLSVDVKRRAAIQRHHSVTHVLHWALHEVVSQEATQKGSFVGPDKLTFDFNSAALTPQQVRDIERMVNEKIVENTPISWKEVPYSEVKGRPDIMQFFGDKYGDTVRVVDIGGYSKELCAGTHARATGEIGLFRIISEAAVAAGVRRIEAVAGLNAYDTAFSDSERLKTLAAKLNSPLAEIEKKLDALLLQQKELERALKTAQQREAAGRARDLLASAETHNGTPTIIANLGTADGDTLQNVADALKAHGFAGVVLLGGVANEAVALVASVSPDFIAKYQAGKLIQTVAPIVGGKGGGRPDSARGGGKDPSKLDEALAEARKIVTGSAPLI